MTVSRNVATLGTIYCIFSAVAYTAYNVCLRYVSVKQDAAWVNCVQASVGMVVFGLYLMWQSFNGRRALPPWKELIALVILGIVTQLGGVLLVLSMGIVGVGVTGTLQMGVMLAASAVMGRIVLGERITWTQSVAIVLITASVVFFSLGAQQQAPSAAVESASTAAQPETSPWLVLLGIGGGILAGIAFAALTVGIRKTVGEATSAEAIVFLISAMGVVAIGPWCVYKLGPQELLATPPSELGTMLLAGVMNLFGFLLITKSLEMITVVRVNVLNNGLVMALTVIAGIAIFKEAWNPNIGLGILLSIVGSALISLAGSPEGTAEAAESPAILTETTNAS